MPLTFGRDVLDEGEFAQLVCFVSKGDEPLSILWALKGDIISSEPTLTTALLGTRTSMLTISSVGYRHSGTYTCTAKNKAGVTSETAELKVNGNCLNGRFRMYEEGWSTGGNFINGVLNCLAITIYLFVFSKI